MYIKKYLISILLLLAHSSYIHATWTNSGVMNLNNSKMNLPSFENNGELILSGESKLSFKELSGSGIIKIKSGTTILKADKFLFNGTIECDSNLEILSETPESQINITRQGNGTITIKSLE